MQEQLIQLLSIYSVRTVYSVENLQVFVEVRLPNPLQIKFSTAMVCLLADKYACILSSIL